MKTWYFVFALLFSAVIIKAQDLVLVKDGKAASVIVIAEDSKWSCIPDALKVLTSGIKDITSVELQSVKVSQGNLKKVQEKYKDKSVILLGKSAWTDDLQLKCPDSKDDTFLVQTLPNILLLMGNDDAYTNCTNFCTPESRGTYHAVVKFLEDQGMRVFGEYSCARIFEKKSDITVKPVKYTESPYFPYRGIGGAKKEFAPHIRWAGYGGAIDLWTTKHTFEMWRNWGKVFTKDHPEYFCLNKSNCLSNNLYMIAFPHEGVVDEIIREAKEYFSSPVIKRIPGLRYFLVLQNDYFEEPCVCEKCQSQIDYSRDPRGWFSDYIANAAVKTAEAIGKDFPEATIVQSAYEHYYLPPKNIKKYPTNTIVTISQTRSRLLNSEKLNEAMQVVDEWQQKQPGGVAFQRYYNCIASSVIPRFFPHAIISNIKAMKDADGKHGVPIIGEFHYTKKGGWWYDLLEYITARALWNPDLDVDALLDDFCKTSFGKAEKPMRKYLDLLEEFYVTNPDRAFYSNEELKRLEDCIEEASTVQNEEPFRSRVAYFAGLFYDMKKTMQSSPSEKNGKEFLKAQIEYNFDFELSEVIGDTSGNDRHAILVGAKRIKAGEENKAVAFDGKENYIKLREPYQLGEAYSLEAMVMPYPMNDKKQIYGELDMYKAYHIFGSSANCHMWDKVSVSLRGGKCVFHDQGLGTITGDMILEAGKWYHIAAIRSQDGSMKLYINGKLSVFSNPKTDSAKKRPSLALVGASGGVSSRYGDMIADCRGFFNGVIDSVKVYDGEIPPAQIQYDYEHAAARK